MSYYQGCDYCGSIYDLDDDCEIVNCVICRANLCPRCRVYLPGGDFSCLSGHEIVEEIETEEDFQQLIRDLQNIKDTVPYKDDTCL